MNKTKLSFIIPCYRSEKTIEFVIDEIVNVVSQRENDFDYEIICVDDCSPDNVWQVLEKLTKENQRIIALQLAKNKGKQCAQMAGYRKAQGDIIIDLDDDGQSPIPELWRIVDPIMANQADFVTAAYYKKKESLFKRFGSLLNAKMVDFLISPPKGFRVENFSAMRAFIKDEIIKYNNPFPYEIGIILHVTHNVQMVLMEQRHRADDIGGGFTFRKSLKLLLDGFTAFSVKPLRFASICGMIFALIGFVFGIYTIIRKLVNPAVQLGYSSLMSALVLSSGMLMLMMGMLGEYVGRIYMSINSVSQYTVKKEINNMDNEDDAI